MYWVRKAKHNHASALSPTKKQAPVDKQQVLVFFVQYTYRHMAVLSRITGHNQPRYHSRSVFF